MHSSVMDRIAAGGAFKASMVAVGSLELTALLIALTAQATVCVCVCVCVYEWVGDFYQVMGCFNEQGLPIL